MKVASSPAIAFACGLCGQALTRHSVPHLRALPCSRRSLKCIPNVSRSARLRARMADTTFSGNDQESAAFDAADSSSFPENMDGKEPGFVEPDADLFEKLEENGTLDDSAVFNPEVPLLNSITITGRLGQDPTLRHVGSDESRKVPLLTFSVAVTDDIPAGMWEPGMERTTSWFNCEMWGPRAESGARFMRKGLRVGVSGRLGFTVYTGRDGNEVQSTVIMVDNFEILQSKSEPDAGSIAGGGGGGGGSGGNRAWRGRNEASNGASGDSAKARYGARGTANDSAASQGSPQVPPNSQAGGRQTRRPSYDKSAPSSGSPAAKDAEDDGLPF